MFSLLLCFLGTSASMRSHQAAEWNANAAANTATTVFTVTGTQARWFGSRDHNWKVILTKIMLGEAYASVDEGPDLVVEEIVRVHEKDFAGQGENGPWTFEVTWTRSAVASKKGFWADYDRHIRNQNPECLTKWVVNNIPRGWNMQKKCRVYMTEYEFTVIAVGFTEVTTEFKVSGTKARQVVFDSHLHAFNMKAIVTRILSGEDYIVTSDFPLDLKKQREINNKNDEPWWVVDLVWTASPIIQDPACISNMVCAIEELEINSLGVGTMAQKKYFTELQNMDTTKLETLTKWVIEHIPDDRWNVEEGGRRYMKNASEFKIEGVA